MIKLIKNDLKTCDVLVDEFKQTIQPTNPEKLLFSGVDGRDVYNITAPFLDEGDFIIAGRVEERDSEDSQVYFFVEHNGRWIPREGAPIFDLQDPFVTRIDGELVLGGVETFPSPTIEGALGWRTIFYKGKSLASLKRFAQGPDGMKDLRLVELQNGSIGVLTRPQGKKGGKGKIGFSKISSLDQLTLEVIEVAPLLTGQFKDEEWGGGNEMHVLSNGLLGILGHIASFDKVGKRKYFPMVFVLNPETLEYSDLQIIALRSNFIDGPAKRTDLVDVVFSGGLVRKSNGTAVLYAGISDVEAQTVTIQDPFIQYENEENK
ncbi:DUF1861 family protein [Gracilibacillus timonensis]|uniref:DUF1861 family protein n=1 Tax=Gracilibacillus timonensis TaxID=1816696 RepID=UPI000824CA48|nr:DUF1861 family protein [Gracilibacillus timonensis]